MDKNTDSDMNDDPFDENSPLTFGHTVPSPGLKHDMDFSWKIPQNYPNYMNENPNGIQTEPPTPTGPSTKYPSFPGTPSTPNSNSQDSPNSLIKKTHPTESTDKESEYM
jgi:hypothetical protein